MKNFTHPIQPNLELITLALPQGGYRAKGIFLSENEFTDKRDLLGFLQTEPDPYVFLTKDEKETSFESARNTT